MKICDLHNHSIYSDGSLSPVELIKMAEDKGVSALALTDHNTAKGLREFMAEGEKRKAAFTDAGSEGAGTGTDRRVETVAGCEFTTEYKEQELHIVGLFFPEGTWDKIEEYVYVMKQSKKQSNHDLIERLQQAGFDITYEEVAAITDADEFNRAHVARVLAAKGYIKEVKEAFDNLLNEGGRYYVPPKRLDTFETIRFIKSLGAVSVLAHPFLSLDYDELVDFLPLAKSAGLDAMETGYSEFDAEQTAQAEELAERFDLAKSGGSDFHGDGKPEIEMGTGKGDLCVPYEYYVELKGINAAYINGAKGFSSTPATR